MTSKSVLIEEDINKILRQKSLDEGKPVKQIVDEILRTVLIGA